MDRDHVEVCIVGGSLAGATLACHLATQGVSVCLFEKRTATERTLCAELSHGGLLPQIDALTGCSVGDLRSASLDCLEVVAGRHRLHQRFELGQGVTIDRVRLEARLLERAARLGVEVQRPATVRHVHVDEAAAVVASAERSWLATRVGLSVQPRARGWR